VPQRSGTPAGGFDLTFSGPQIRLAPLYALIAGPLCRGPGRPRPGGDRGIAYADRYALFVDRGDLRPVPDRTTGLVAAAFVHRTSRNGDPQLHTHVPAANVVRGEDGRWSAPTPAGSKPTPGPPASSTLPFCSSAYAQSLEAGSNRSGDTQVLRFRDHDLHSVNRLTRGAPALRRTRKRHSISSGQTQPDPRQPHQHTLHPRVEGRAGED
jgi:TrwC relaxase